MSAEPRMPRPMADRWSKRVLLSGTFLVFGIVVGAGMPGVVQRALQAAGLSVAPTIPPAKPHEDPKGPAKSPSIVKMSAAQIAAQKIATAKAEPGVLARHLLVPGTIAPSADRIARVPVRVVGTVAEMRKRLGEPVVAGDVVAVLDSREVADAKSDYLTAQVQAELQKTNFERQQKLLEIKTIAKVQVDQARASYQEARLKVDLARQKLSALGLNATEVESAAKRDETTPNQSTLRRYELRAPLSGRVVERKVDVGMAVGKEGDPSEVYTVADLSTVWIELAVPRFDLSKVKDGARVVVLPAAGDDNGRSEGKVVFVSPMLNADTRSARVIAALPNPTMAWRPGSFVTTELEIGQDKVAVRIPKVALQTIDGRPVVFVRVGDGFAPRHVALGRADDDAYEVTAGLKAGEEIAVGNTFVLKAEQGKTADEREPESGHVP